MAKQRSTQSRGSGKSGTKTAVSPKRVEEILAGLRPLYSKEVQEKLEDALEALGETLATDGLSERERSILADAETVLDEIPGGMEATRKELEELFQRI